MRAATNAAKNLIRSFNEVRQTKSIFQRVREFRGFVNVRYETDDFVVTTAQTPHDLLKVLELRHEVFVKEWQNRRTYHGLDVDHYDFQADHLIIREKKFGEIVGTYRLISSHFSHDFYSASEFEIRDFTRLPAVKLEAGRACVHPDFRNGLVIDLLWRGLSRYIFATKTEYLFGCASLKSVDPVLLGQVYKLMRQEGHWVDEFRVRALWDYQFPNFTINPEHALAPAQKREVMPPLLRSYLAMGAKIYGWPALDRDFACTDLFTILDWRNLHPKFQSRFMVKDDAPDTDRR